MEVKIQRIFLTNEFNPSSDIDALDTNTDVIVALESGEKYIASFITYRNIESIYQENLSSGDFRNGKYFWKKQMLLIRDCKKDTIKEVVNHLIDEGDFNFIFEKMSD